MGKTSHVDSVQGQGPAGRVAEQDQKKSLAWLNNRGGPAPDSDSAPLYPKGEIMLSWTGSLELAATKFSPVPNTTNIWCSFFELSVSQSAGFQKQRTQTLRQLDHQHLRHVETVHACNDTCREHCGMLNSKLQLLSGVVWKP
jgi:hypothetical protein